MLPLTVRRTARRLGVGRMLVRVHALRALTLPGAITLVHDRPRYLGRILEATPIPAGEGPLEVHMLLHHERILEGIWALYSFAHFAPTACQMFVHSDGSLTASDAAQLHRVLPAATVISRSDADNQVETELHARGLHASLRFRRELIFALKLFDPFAFGDRPEFVLLDSDVLFFRAPCELTAPTEANLYSPDNGYRYCLNPQDLREILGRECIPAFNPGVIRVKRSVLDFQKVEQYLQRAEFWGSGSRPHYYAELTLWAMLLTSAGARPLPASYAITPSLDGESPVSGHFCGGGYPSTWFYSRGLPHLAAEFGLMA
ncbi:MAG: hypothetical protein JO020_02070 [Chloroflexi bacterium]|nr:hypothetical protein [Chloroflexota bacterium]MBV9133041.1 hypothetical protein [Chloroflexota bacterium]MBV9892935.1 hypothetical protein [Chloroflexota bacterium]